ncbi:18006_t:CDS:1, partial [Cetraspora pellucida]
IMMTEELDKYKNLEQNNIYNIVSSFFELEIKEYNEKNKIM